VAPFFDATLAERGAQIADEWETDAQSVLDEDPAATASPAARNTIS
jgi:hypothetical protein